MIGDSVARVDTGARLVDHAGATMEEIVRSVRTVSELIAGMAAASQEQSAGIEQVNGAVGQMEQVVQQNATLVEEAAAATQSMNAQAASLLERVSVFHLGGGGPSEQAGDAPLHRTEAQLPFGGSSQLPPARRRLGGTLFTARIQEGAKA